ncbi:putative penicillin-binding protein PbpX [Andreprevotia sp. IGB-42]|uniref:serine hydrolase domain-containing protein n=1 Tax=Andreprevotia sp. IGB-42 TaxID=2497473 RepID=UPI001356E60B|nr:serine hydrolase domain-containing protein [Andreprevotia sp. IGB-42]KAF0813075.1 putative penicillin-binding protein PbpX [Andreprevotia sp. IGB-42]
MKIRFALFACLLALPCFARDVAQTLPALNRYVETQLARGGVPGAALVVVTRDQVLQVKGFGMRGPDGQAVTPDSLFILGSVSKSFTALAVMQLVEAGKIKLDEPVVHYLPDFRLADPAMSAQITVRQLLNHQSGISTADGNRDFGMATHTRIAERITQLGDIPQQQAPGANYEYSNLNYVILGALIERASGQSYGQYVQQHIFTPLRMTQITADAAQARQRALATGHRYWFGQAVATDDVPRPDSNVPAGYLYASAADMGRYLQAQLNGGELQGTRVLSAAGIDTLHRDGVAAGTDTMYAMGWMYEAANPAVFSHGGDTADYHSYMAISPREGWGMVLLVNANSFFSGPQLPTLGNQLVDIIHGQAGEPMQVLPGILLPLAALLGITALLATLIAWHGYRLLAGKAHRPILALVSALLLLAVTTVLLLYVPTVYHANIRAVIATTPDAGLLLAGNAALAGLLLLLVLLRRYRSGGDQAGTANRRRNQPIRLPITGSF